MTAFSDRTLDRSARLSRSLNQHPELRIALVGGGRMALNHARAVPRVRVPARVVAVADPSEAARRAAVELAPGAAGFTSLEELLAETQVDVVHVCTPPVTHRDLARQVIEAGAHVYVEKPFAESTRDAAELLQIAASRGRLVCAGHQLLFESPTRKVQALIPALGRLAHLESYFSFRALRRSPGGRTPLRPDLQLLDILPHPVYLLLHFLGIGGQGRPELVGLDVGGRGTVHALVRSAELTGSLVVTLEGRPVESYMRLSGANGSLLADYVRGTVQRHIGPGTSGIDKVLWPYREAAQLVRGTTSALARRALNRQRSYPGLPELFEAFYRSVRDGTPPPLSPESILETTRIWEEVKLALERQTSVAAPASVVRGPCTVVTGGTGFLGRAVVGALSARGKEVRVVARREPAAWERVEGVEYLVADLGRPLPDGLLGNALTVIHAAAETAGGWEGHRRNSIEATEHLLRAARAAGATRVLHVSSLAVLDGSAGVGPVVECSPLYAQSRSVGPYVWGKLESERLAQTLGKELGLDVKVVRPGALVDYAEFEPPGRLGKRLGNLFVAVGSPRDRLGVADLDFAAHVLVWMVEHFDRAPKVLNLVEPELPTKRDLLDRLRRANPDLTVLWLPMQLLLPLSWMARLVQKLLRPGEPAIDVARVFAVQAYDTSAVAQIARDMEDQGEASAPDRRDAPLAMRSR